jgi:hypothetical protein
MGNGSRAHSLFWPELWPALPYTGTTPAQPKPALPSSSPILSLHWTDLPTWPSSATALLPSPLSPMGGPFRQLRLLHRVNDSTMSDVRHHLPPTSSSTIPARAHNLSSFSSP